MDLDFSKIDWALGNSMAGQWPGIFKQQFCFIAFSVSWWRPAQSQCRFVWFFIVFRVLAHMLCHVIVATIL